MHCTSSRSIILWAPKLFFASAASVLECIDICARHRVSICICSELPLESFHSICHWLGMLRHTNADTSHPAAHTHQLTTHPDQNCKCKTHYYEVFLFRFRENKLHVTSVEKYCRNVTPVFPGGQLGPPTLSKKTPSLLSISYTCPLHVTKVHKMGRQVHGITWTFDRKIPLLDRWHPRLFLQPLVPPQWWGDLIDFDDGHIFITMGW